MLKTNARSTRSNLVSLQIQLDQFTKSFENYSEAVVRKVDEADYDELTYLRTLNSIMYKLVAIERDLHSLANTDTVSDNLK